MVNETPVFVTDKKNNIDDDFIKTRVEIKKKIWRIFRGLVSIKNSSLTEALTEAVVLWIEEIESVKHVCCVCKNDIDNSYFRKIVDGDIFYYCNTKCIIKEQDKE